MTDPLQPGPAAQSIAILRQGESIVRRIGAEAYARRPAVSPEASVGGHFRHCLDFYSAFLDGLDGGRIDYDGRRRDPDIETDPAQAAESCRALVARLEHLDATDLARPVKVRLDGGVPGGPEWTDSTLGRECVFLASHTIHHYALIATVMRALGIETDPHFGVAPSTLEHWKRTRPGV